MVDKTPKAFDKTPKVFDKTPKVFDKTPKVFDKTPKVFASFSPGLEPAGDNPGKPKHKGVENAESVG